MSTLQITEKRTVFALRMGMAVPFLYFGIQIIAALFYPGYSFLNRDASTLGSDGSSFPLIFNGGAIIVGIGKFIAAWGFLRAFRHLGRYSIFAWLTSLTLIASGLASINAGVFPLPDPRHTASLLALLGIGTFLLPALLPAALWKLCEARPIKVYFIANIIAFIALIPIMSGLIQILSVMAGVESQGYQSFLNNYHGLLQRVAALIALSPIGVGAYLLADRIKGSVRETLAL